MPIPAGSWRVTVNGQMPSGEGFVTGFWMGGAAYTNHASLQTLSDSVRDSFQSNALTAIRAMNPAGLKFQKIKTYAYDGSGAKAVDVAESAIVTGQQPGTSVAATLPMQACMVVTLHTGRPGRSYRGRMYVPAISAALATHQYAAADVNAVTGAVANWFTNLNSLLTPYVAVMSTKLGATAVVTDVAADSIPDTQRGRAEHLAASTRSVVTVTNI